MTIGQNLDDLRSPDDGEVKSSLRRAEVRLAKAQVKQVDFSRVPALPEMESSTQLKARNQATSRPFEVLIFGRGFLKNGGLAVAQALSGNLPAVFLIQNRSEALAIEDYNQEFGAGILWAYTIEEAKAKARPYIKKLIKDLGGVKFGAFTFRGLDIADPDLEMEAALLKGRIGDVPFSVISPNQFDAWAGSLGLSQITEALRASLATLYSA